MIVPYNVRISGSVISGKPWLSVDDHQEISFGIRNRKKSFAVGEARQQKKSLGCCFKHFPHNSLAKQEAMGKEPHFIWRGGGNIQNV